ncbi:helix-turn-helix domain-containing protein [Pseudoalteromonas rubra]|uniref:HTH cro/C1-type domain-containing protein n=1 Tax=Pseudoalteromonas rubra TaxID=43658 RepID=A0A0F4Q9F4_9GAMM|nr:helix-turn-helix transcriptional regulator [Pseudoalteromonas rubra]KJZ04341.1 hypothetical protein TW77_23545 [Pseudoalteromonas rubra]
MNHFLIKERERLGLQQKEVYEIINVGKSTYYRWENGAPIPSDKLAELASLGFDVAYVVTGKRKQASGPDVGAVCFTQENLKNAIGAFLLNTAELGLLNKSPDASVNALINMAIYSLCKEVGETFEEDTSPISSSKVK